jgi:nitrogen regulatory protein PII
MKQINAYIKPHRLTKVTMTLQKAKGLGGMTVFEVKGFGRRRESDPIRPVVDDLMDFAEYVKIEIFCPNDLAEELVSIINKAAYTGLRGDGKIFVLDVEKGYRIGKGEIV